MTQQRRQTDSFSLDVTGWAAHLSKSIDTIGADCFPENLIDALKSLVNFDYSVVFAFHQSEKPQCLFHTFSAKEKLVFVDDYIKGPYLLDPIFKACTRNVDSKLHRLSDIAPDRFYQGEYYRSYYIQTGLSEEIFYTFFLPHNASGTISLMRSGDSTRFTAREFKLLSSAAPIIISLAQRHWQEVPELFDIGPTEIDHSKDSALIERTVRELFGQRITTRETQVIAQVLEGHSSDSIAKSLGISVGTVRIHRRNIYAKLRISSQKELFAIFLNEIAMVGN